ncbi:thermonuclease family protein [Desulfopila inferna]|uniref:thermonuclease family protein n=1 Tax=Desulfopila inferna TaxID=468528 RepID=UPI0019624D30|nr:thermonuclease family protein [Desulfopila inferna]MBM9602959.1 thermonuclease family protein [Desulfopila inferna]
MFVLLSALDNRNILYLFSILLALGLYSEGLIPSTVLASSIRTDRYPARVVKVVDGDTIVIKSGHTTKLIRLWGIDTPEWDQPFSGETKTFVKELLLNKRVYLEPLYLDKYNREIAQVYISDINVSRLLVEKGYAWVHVYYCNKKICSFWKRLQKKARNAHTGLWGKGRPVAPWKWKRMKNTRHR